MTHATTPHDAPDPHNAHDHDDAHSDDGIPHVSAREYLNGFVLSVVLTAIPFGLVMTKTISNSTLAAVVILFTGWFWIDPAISLVIAAVIVIGTWGLLRDSLDMALDAAPRGIDTGKVRDWLAARPGVTEVHDLHIWAMSTTETALTAHLIRPDNAECDVFLRETAAGLEKSFRIGHPTLQVETGEGGHPCHLAPSHVV